MKNYTFAPVTATVMDNTVSLNGHFFKVTDEVADLVYKVLQDALANETAKQSVGAAVKPDATETVAKSEPKTSKKSSKKTSTKSSDSTTVSTDEVSDKNAKNLITCVATMTPYGSKGLIVGNVKSGTWKVIRQRLISKFGEDNVSYVRQNGDTKGHFDFKSKTLRDKALNDDNLPIVIWDKSQFNKKA